MNLDLLCRCSHRASVHVHGAKRRECKPSCGCGEFRPGARPQAGSDDAAEAGAA